MFTAELSVQMDHVRIWKNLKRIGEKVTRNLPDVQTGQASGV